MKLKDILSPSFRDYRKPSKPMIVVATDSDFCRETVDSGILTPQQMAHAAERYLLGKSISGRCIFWMIDDCGIVRDGHVGDSWVSLLLKAREPKFLSSWYARHCLFGLHLISDIIPRPSSIGIVESEKSAVILSELYPDNIWLATMYPTNFTINLLKPLRGHQVMLYPHTDETMSNYLCWLEIADMARRDMHLDITCSSILEDHATPAQKHRQIDLVGFLYEEPHTDFYDEEKNN